MTPIISKSTFLEFLMCPKNTWLKIHKPELLEQFQLSSFELQLVEQGNEVEEYARNLFPGAVKVTETGDEAVRETERFMVSRIPAIFQATFFVDGYIAKNDVLEWDKEGGCWNLCEIKGTNSLKDDGGGRDHIDDLTFQAVVLKRSNVPVGRYFLIYLNREYVRAGDLDVQELFKREDVTEKILARMPQVEEQMAAAGEYLRRGTEPNGGCDCIYLGRSSHCSTFSYSNPAVPPYSVHDISRIGSSKKKLATLVEREIFSLDDIPADVEFSEIQTNQIHVHRTGRPIIVEEGIKTELEPLSFPLYFLDYETFAPAIPMFNGFHPYQRIPFQFSLHIVREQGSEPEHVEYLHREASDPSPVIAKLLAEHIGEGSVISWNKSFEQGVNRELGERHPEYRIALERINTQMYDLQDVFRKQHYVHPEFKGKTSVKKVLPALVPGKRHADLNIKEGGAASDAWWQLISPATPEAEKEQVAHDLLTYCGLDTYAMYQIWKHLYDLVF